MGKGFWGAFLLSVVVLGGIMTATVAMVQPGMEGPATSVDSSSYEYHPIGADALSLAVFGTGDGGQLAECVLLRFLPEKGQIPLSLLPPETILTHEDGQTATLAQIFAEQGAAEAKKALSQTLEVPMERYAALDKETFVSLCSKTGTVTTELLQDVDYETAERAVHLSAGTQKLDGQGITELFEAPYLPEQISQRSTTLGNLIARYINQNLDAASDGRSEKLFTAAVNQVKTDLSFTDFALRIEALHFVSKLAGVNVAGCIPVSGEAQEEGFRLSQDYLSQVKAYF